MKTKPTYHELEKELEAIKTTNRLIEKSPIVRFMWKNQENWPVEYVSENVKNIFGYTGDDFITKKIVFSEIIYPEDLQRVQNEVSSQSKTVFYSIEHEPYRIIDKAGKIKWINDITLIRRDENNEITHYEGIITEITKQKKTEKALKTERTRFKNIMDTNPSGVYITDNEYNIEYINPVIEKEFGAINGRKCYSYFHDLTKPCEWCKNKEVFAGKSVKWEWYSKKNNKYYELFDTPLENSDGSISKFEMFFDITERKKNEQELKRRENYLIALNKATEILSAGNPKTQIQKFTKSIGKAANAGRTYIFKNHKSEKGELLLSQIAEYVNDSIEPEIDNPLLQNLSYNDWGPRWHKILKKGNIIKGKVADFPQKEREILEQQEIKAVLIIPIMIEKEFWGFIGFDNCINDNYWQTAEIEYLKASAEKISTRIKEHRKQELLENENKRFHATMNSIDAAVYVTDMQTYELLFLNKYGKQNWGDKVGEKCYKALQGLNAPCDFCTNSKLLDKNGNIDEPYVWEFQNTITKQWYQLRDQAIQWTDGRLVRLEIATDITERKEAELIIHNQNQEYEALNEELRITNDELQIGKAQIQKINSQLTATINALPDLMIETDSVGRIYNYHAPQADILYTTPDNFLGKKIDEILPPDSAKICNNAITQAIKNGKHTGAVYSLQLPQGLHWFEISVAAKNDNNNERVIMLIRDITKNKKAEQALKESEEKLKEAQKTAHLGHWELDIINNKLTWSDEIYRLFELKPQEFNATYEAFLDNIHPDDKDKVNKAYINSLKNQTPYEIEHRLLLKSGKIKYVLEKCKTKYDKSGNPLHSFGTVLDITTQKENEQALKASEENYRLLTETMKDVVVKISTSGELLYVSPSTEKFGGYKQEEEVGSDISKYFADENDYLRAIKLIAEVVETHKSGNFEFMYKPKNKAPFPVEHTYMPLIKDNKVYAIQMVLRDITERKEAEQALKESEEKYKNIFENAPIGIVTFDLEGNVLNANKSLLKILGSPSIEASKKINILKSENIENSNFSQDFKNCVVNKQAIKNENDYTTYWGRKTYMHYYLTPILDNHNNIESVQCIFEDFTKRKEMENLLQKQNKQLAVSKEKAEESNRLKSAFLANMSHEIRTPMNAILGFASFLKKPTLSTNKKDQYVEIINNSGNHLLNLINDIIDISKIDAKQMSIIETECKLNEFLFEIYQFFHSVVAQKSKQLKIILTKELPDNQDVIKIDTTRLRQILINLIGNAVKFTNSGFIEIKYSIIDNKHIQFEIKDTGIGISENELQFIFDRFRQADETSTRQYGGTGLGLAISKSCAELLEGKIWVKSEIEKGSTFYFTVPYKAVINPKNEDKLDIINTETIFSEKTILIVEDEPFSAMILEEILEPTQAIIIKALNGLEAIELCKNNLQIDIVLMDIQLPELDGLKATKEILKIRPDLPIISQTANAMHNDKQKSLNAGCVDYITKPINEKELIEKIAKQIIT